MKFYRCKYSPGFDPASYHPSPESVREKEQSMLNSKRLISWFIKRNLEKNHEQCR